MKNSSRNKQMKIWPRAVEKKMHPSLAGRLVCLRILIELSSDHLTVRLSDHQRDLDRERAHVYIATRIASIRIDTPAMAV